MTESEQALEILLKEQGRIEAFERLQHNADFQAFRKLIEERRENLRDLLETAKDEDLANVRGQLFATRGVLELFDSTIAPQRQVEVQKKIKLLKGE